MSDIIKDKIKILIELESKMNESESPEEVVAIANELLVLQTEINKKYPEIKTK